MLKQANMIKQLLGNSGGNLSAAAGESLLVKRIECIPSASDGYLTLSVDRVTVGYYRVKGKSGNHLGTILSDYLKRNLMEFLTLKGVNVAIPVAEGQTFNVSRYAEPGNVIIVYDKYDAGDVGASMPNGSASKEFTFIQYAKVGTAPTATGDALIDTALSPAEFPDFPCGKVVPALHTIKLLGIVGCPVNNASGANVNFETTFMKLIKGREVLFDEDRNGIPFDAQDDGVTEDTYMSNFSLIGPCTEILLNTNAIVNGDPLMFEPALEFVSGEELNTYLSVIKNGAATWTDNVDDQAFILNVVKQ